MRIAFPGGSYIDGRPSGEHAVLYAGSHIGSHLGVLPLAGDGRPNQDVLFLRITPSGEFKIAGQGHDDGLCWEWASGQWATHGPTHGVSPVIYDNAGTLLIVRPPVPGHEQTSQGYRFVDASGRVWFGDETYADKDRHIWEYTTLGVTVGQGESGCHVLTPEHRLLEAGDTRFVRYAAVDGLHAIAIVKPGESCLHILHTPELLALPLVAQPPIVVPPKEPTVPTFPFPAGYDPLPRLKAVRATFPTPLGSQHARFLIAACAAVGYGAGLLKKDGGTHITLPNGVNVSQDWMVFQNGSGCDFLSDGEGAAGVGWGDAQANPGTWVDVSGLVDVPPVDPPIDPPKPPDTTSEAIKAIMAILVAQDERIKAIEDTSPATVDLTGYARKGDKVTVLGKVPYLGNITAHGTIDGGPVAAALMAEDETPTAFWSKVSSAIAEFIGSVLYGGPR